MRILAQMAPPLPSCRCASLEAAASASSFLAMLQHLLGQSPKVLRAMPFAVKGQDRLAADLRLVDRLAFANDRGEHVRTVVYLSPAGKYHRLTHLLSLRTERPIREGAYGLPAAL